MLFENVVKLCSENKISISRLEKTIGLGNATIRGWEHSSPKVDTAKKVADYFGISLDELVNGRRKTKR